jgi:hypothetical protein
MENNLAMDYTLSLALHIPTTIQQQKKICVHFRLFLWAVHAEQMQPIQVLKKDILCLYIQYNILCAPLPSH